MCILSPTTAPDCNPTAQPTPARQLPPQQRQLLAVQAIAGHSVTDLAQQHEVSRKFVYQQAERASQALEQTFSPPPPPAEPVLFQLPVTRPWVRQFILAMLLIGHSSLRGVQEIFRDLFNHPIALGTIHNIVRDAVADARAVNARQELSAVRIGAHDEIFQNGRPVLVGADVRSTYCYLLSQEEHRDADTWAIRLLDLQPQGFAPAATIADGGTGLRAGQTIALGDVPCRADVFHAERELGQLSQYLQNRAYGVMASTDKLERHRARSRRAAADPDLTHRLEASHAEEARAVALADEVALLETWLRQDVLAVVGPPLPERLALFQFLVAELQQREPLCPHRIGPVRRHLENQRDDLLAFVADLDRDILSLAGDSGVSPHIVRELLAMQALPLEAGERWRRYTVLRAQLGVRFQSLNEAVSELRAAVVRASSVIENLNSRLRNYFFLRRHLGPEYLELLRFFLNHRRFIRSEHAERVDKSPAELLTGQEHLHWLELLGYERFRRAG